MNTQITLSKNFISFFIITIIFSSVELKSQTFKEKVEFYENGQPKTEIVKNNDLIIIRKNEFDINGNLIEFYNYDPTTGLKDGEFLQGSNKGFYTQGEINCNNYTIVLNDNNYGNRFFLKGKFTKGKPVGLIDIFSMRERQNLQRDPYTSYLLTLEHGKRINYSTYVGTGVYDKTKLMSLNYNEDGYLNGEQLISEYTKLNYKNGVLIEVMTKNEQNPNIYKDSISRNNKFWKINNKYYKNIGWLEKLYWPQYSGNTEVIIKYPDDDSGYNVFFGNQNTKFLYLQPHPMVGINYGGFGELNKNGIYERIDGESDLPSCQTHGRQYNFADFFFKVPLESNELDLKYSDISLFDFFEKESSYTPEKEYLKNNKGLSFIKKLKELLILKNVNTINFYKIMQNVIDSDYTPFIEVYLGSYEGENYKTYRETHKETLKEAEERIIREKEEQKRREEEALKLEEEALKLKERVKKDIEKADLEFVINNYLSFLGEDEKVNNFAYKSTFQKWEGNYNNQNVTLSLTNMPKGFLKYETNYGNTKQVILIDGNSKKGYLYTNYRRRKKLDESTINNLAEISYAIPEVNYLKNSKYEGVEIIKNEQNTEEQAYKIRTNSNEVIYYSVIDFRKIVKISVDETKTFFADWKNIEGVKFPHENISMSKSNKVYYLLTEFKLDPILENDYFSKKIKF